MTWFMTRVVLHNAGREDYEELHQYMEGAGFVKTIKGDVMKWDLPDAMYDYRTSDTKVTAENVRDKAIAAADKTKKRNSILTVKYDAWAASNLTKASP